MKVTELENIPSGNPFHHDIFHMGTYLGGSGKDFDVCVMFKDHEHNKYIIVVDCVTGERIRVDFKR